MPRVARRALEWVWPLVAPAVLLTTVVAIAAHGSVLNQAVTLMLIYFIVVVGLQMFMGNSGVLSFGHIAFFAIGAYADALVTIPQATKDVVLPQLPHFIAHAHLSPMSAVLLGGLVAALAAAVVALPLMRLSGIAAGLGTFSLLIIVQVVATNWTSMTGGSNALIGVPLDLGVWTALVWALLALACAFVFACSRTGLRLRASREDPIAARSIGVRIVRDRSVAFVLSAFVAGVGGALFAHAQGAFDPGAFSTSLTFLVLAMLVVGGSHSLLGAVVGTVLISTIEEGARRLEGGFGLAGIEVPFPTGSAALLLGVVMLAVLLFRPSGITGGAEFTWPLGQGRRSRGSVGSAAGPRPNARPGSGEAEVA